MRTTFALLLCAACLSAAPAPEAPTAPDTDGVPTVSVGHARPISRVVLSPDERRVITHDGANVRIWDVESRKEIKLLTRFATNHSNSSVVDFHFVPEKDWLIAAGSSVYVYRASTLEPIEEWPLSVDGSVWALGSTKGYWADGVGSRLEFGELAGGDPRQCCFKTLVIIKNEAIKDRPVACRELFQLADGRLLAVTNYGLFIADPQTWQVTSPDWQGIAGNHEFFGPGGQQTVPSMTFTASIRERHLSQGPEGTLLELTHANSGKTKVNVLAGPDLAVARQFEIDGVWTLMDIATWNPTDRVLWLKQTRMVMPLNFDSLKPGPAFGLEDALALDKDGGIQTATAGRDKTKWLLGVGRVICPYDLTQKKAGKPFGDRVPSFARIIPHPSEFEFIITDRNSTAKRVRITPGGLQVTSASGTYSSAAYDPTDAETIAYGSLYDPTILLSDRKEWPKEDFRLPQKPQADIAGAPAHLAYSPDGSLLVEHSPYGVTVYDVKSGARLLNEKLSQAFSSYTAQITAISPDNKWLVVFDGPDKLIGYDLTQREKAWEQRVEKNGKLIYFAGPKTFATLTKDNLEYRSAETGALKVATYMPGSLFADATAVRRDGKLVAYGSYALFVFDSEEEKVVFEAKTTGRIQAMAFLSNPRYLITAGADNLLRLWDVEEKKELCALALFEDDDAWVVSTRDLRFDGSEDGLGKMYVVQQGNVLPLESLFERFYTPKLFASLLAGEKLDPPQGEVKQLTAAPTVRLELADASRNLKVEDDGADHDTTLERVKLRAVADAGESTLAELRLYQNGKLVASAPMKERKVTFPTELPLMEGLNLFKAVAVNAQRTESRPYELTVQYRPENRGSAPPTAGTGLRLHLLVVGVNAYKNPKYNLNYAVADATAVKERVERQTKAIFTGVVARFIHDAAADKAAIVTAFKEMSANAGGKDVFVFYYAGHGVMSTGKAPEFFLVPHDVTQLYGADDSLREKGLSSSELLELSKSMPAQKQLFILDACQSAGALKSVAMRGAAEEKAIAQLARSSGTHWLTASGSEQFATEFEQLGHGAFTYVLLDGLAGKADTGDGRVTVNELKAYLESQVPEVTQKHKGTPQFPSSYGFGQDFPVVVVGP
jgi:WD40 repeat protein